MNFRRKNTQAAQRIGREAGVRRRPSSYLLVVAAVVYLISASAAGTWIAQQVLAPAFAAFDDFVQAASAKKSPEAANTASPQANSIVFGGYRHRRGTVAGYGVLCAANGRLTAAKPMRIHRRPHCSSAAQGAM